MRDMKDIIDWIEHEYFKGRNLLELLQGSIDYIRIENIKKLYKNFENQGGFDEAS